MTRASLTVAALAFCTFSGVATALAAENACEREMKTASAKYDVPLGVLYAVGLTESGRKDSLQPYAMNIAGKAYFARNLADGLARFAEAQADGISLIDIGCMQINHHFHGAEFPSVARMFEPHANVDYAARFLTVLRKQEGSWTLAVARYHAGPNNNPAQKQYVCAVIVNMVATGFGSWTDEARAFCG
jgi:soluble lytic murein transglycosylase-like protein